MGGYGSGRWGVHPKALTVEECLPLDATVLQREGVFDRGLGHLWSCSWKRGQEVLSSIGYRVEAKTGSPWALRFKYTASEPTGEKTNHDYSVPLDCMTCPRY